MSVDTDSHQHGYINDKERYLGRMKRIEGQARGIAKMIDEEKYCIDILTQVSALTRALQGVSTGLLDDHLKHCVLDAAKLSDEAAVAAYHSPGYQDALVALGDGADRDIRIVPAVDAS